MHTIRGYGASLLLIFIISLIHATIIEQSMSQYADKLIITAWFVIPFLMIIYGGMGR